MRQLLVVFSFFALIPSLPRAAYATEAPDCTLKRLGSIDLTVLDSGRLYVPVTIDNTNALMMLSLDAPYSSIDRAAVDQLNLSTVAAPSGIKITLGKARVTGYAIVNNLTSGSLHFGKAKFLINPETSKQLMEIKPDPVIGDMGFDLFSLVDIELDLAHRKMTLYAQDHCPGRVVYWAARYDAVPLRHNPLGALYFRMELNGKAIETTLSTSALTTSLTNDVAKRLFGYDGHSSGFEPEKGSPGTASAPFRTMNLTAQGLTIAPAQVLFYDRAELGGCGIGTRDGATGYTGCLGPIPLLLGLNVLTKLHLYIATKEKMLYFTPAEAAK